MIERTRGSFDGAGAGGILPSYRTGDGHIHLFDQHSVCLGSGAYLGFSHIAHIAVVIYLIVAAVLAYDIQCRSLGNRRQLLGFVIGVAQQRTIRLRRGCHACCRLADGDIYGLGVKITQVMPANGQLLLKLYLQLSNSIRNVGGVVGGDGGMTVFRYMDLGFQIHLGFAQNRLVIYRFAAAPHL